MVQTILTIVFAVAVGIDFVPKLKKKQVKECVVYAVILLTAYIILLLAAFGIYTPSPLIPIQRAIEKYIL